ncbi:hypothetical protein LCGC14_2957040, partial [marine sediment metagenome]
MNGTSYSAINTYQRCPKLYFYKYVKNLQRNKRSVALTQGTDAHKFLQVFFLALQQGRHVSGAWDEVYAYTDELAAANKELTFEDEHAEYVELLAETLQWIAGYCDQYGEEWEVLHVEEEFLIMFETGEIITFTPDLVVRDRNGYVWIIDHKTTSAIPDSGIPFGDMQALLYYAGVQAIYPECRGFIFNRLRKKIPTQPRLTKTGDKRVADFKRIDTTYEVLRDFLVDEAPDLLNDPTHQQRLAELRDAPERWFWTETVYVNESTEEATLEDVAVVLGQMQASKEITAYPRNLQEDRGYLSCGKCAFQP